MNRAAVRLFVAFLAAVMTGLLAAACVQDSEDGAEAPDVLVRVVDSAGAVLGADTVYWSYKADGITAAHKAGQAAHGSDTTAKAAVRRNAAGSQWGISYDGLHGAVYIRASYHKNIDALCMDHGYAQLAITADTLPKEVALTLSIERHCE
jgi:hypothetical protein